MAIQPLFPPAPPSQNPPLDATDSRIAVAPDVIVVTVHRASGGKQEPVARATRDPEDNWLLAQGTVYLQRGPQVREGLSKQQIQPVYAKEHICLNM